jgi:hypothetical protein
MHSFFDNLYYCFSLPFWMMAAKFVFILLLWSFIALAAYCCLQSRKWHALLVQMEHEAGLNRDDAMFEFMAARSNLRALNQRIAQVGIDAEKPQLDTQLLKHAGDLLMFVLRKETSLLNWGMLGAKLARYAYQAIKNKAGS